MVVLGVCASATVAEDPPPQRVFDNQAGDNSFANLENWDPDGLPQPDEQVVHTISAPILVDVGSFGVPYPIHSILGDESSEMRIVAGTA